LPIVSYQLKANTEKPVLADGNKLSLLIVPGLEAFTIPKGGWILQDTMRYHGVKTVFSKKNTKFSQDTYIPLVE
jgi:hypothetical protein